MPGMARDTPRPRGMIYNCSCRRSLLRANGASPHSQGGLHMDALDVALQEAWNRLSRRVKEDRLEARRRAARRLNKTFHQPPRAWCLAIRANDTRLHGYTC